MKSMSSRPFQRLPEQGHSRHAGVVSHPGPQHAVANQTTALTRNSASLESADVRFNSNGLVLQRQK